MNLDANGAANPNLSKKRQQRASKPRTSIFTDEEKKKLGKDGGGVPYTGELTAPQIAR